MDAQAPSYPTLISELRTSTDPVEDLIRIKNQVVGYETKKQLWVDAGLVTVLATLLHHSQYDVRLQATIILCSLARGPSPCTFALLNPTVLDPVAKALTSNHPASLRLASLQILETLAATCASPHLCHRAPYSSVFQVLLSDHVLTALVEAISDEPRDSMSDRISRAGLKIIVRGCFLEQTQNRYALGVLLPLLSERLTRYMIWSQSASASRPSDSELRVRRRAILPILEAITAIIRDSHERAMRLLLTPALVTISKFLVTGEGCQYREGQASETGVDFEFNPTPLLPQLPVCDTPNKRNASQIGATSIIGSDWPGLTPSADQHHQERPLILWLTSVARQHDGLIRLLFIQLLVALYRANAYKHDGTCKCRERRMEVLVVPMLMRLIEEAYDPAMTYQTSPPPELQTIQALGPEVLAMLLCESSSLASSAVSSPATAISRVAKLLGISFQPPSEAMLPAPWSSLPNPASSGSLELLSPPVLSVEAVHKLRVRESSLKALAALIHEEKHRVELLQQNVGGLIIEAMKTFIYLPSLRSNQSGNLGSAKRPSQMATIQIPNPPAILIAACACVKALSRSVPVSRRELVDAGVAKPTLDLMQHEDIDVQIMATQTMANLLTHYSSVRDILIKEGVIKILGSQLHSPHVRLRFEALFALRNLIYDSPKEVRLQILETCGIDYIARILASTDDKSIVDFPPLDPNGGMEYNPFMTPTIDVGMDGVPDHPAALIADSSGSEDASVLKQQQELCRQGVSPHAEQRHIHRLSLGIQAQALVMIRHFITPPDASVLFDRFIDHLSIPRFFELLANKLRPFSSSSSDPLDTNMSFDNMTASMSTEYAEPQILEYTIMVLVHISACEPRHRALLMNQSEFLRSLQPLLKHPNRGVRQSLLHMVSQLTHERSDEELQSVRGRARTFRQWGWLSDIERLENGIPGEDGKDIDQREAAKRASQQIRGLVSG